MYSLEIQYSKVVDWGGERNRRDLRGNLLARPFVPESPPSQLSSMHDPLLTTVSSTPAALLCNMPFHLLFWRLMCSFPHTAGLFGPKEQAKFLPPVIPHGRVICVADIMPKKHCSFKPEPSHGMT